MRTITRPAAFKRDYKREKKGQHRETVEAELRAVIEMLVADKVLPERYRDHGLAGTWKGYRDCHVRPDLVLIYRKVGDDVLQLVRLGSHSELGI